MTFTKEQRDLIEKQGTIPLLIDGIECVVMRADLFDRVKRIVAYDDRELQPEETYAAALEAWDADGSPQDVIGFSEADGLRPVGTAGMRPRGF